MGGEQLPDNDNGHLYRCRGVLVRSSFELPQILVADGLGVPDIAVYKYGLGLGRGGLG